MSTTAIDPRLRERRASVARAQGRQRLHRLIAVTGVIALLWAGQTVAHSSLIGVRTIRVTGASRTATADVIAASRIRSGDPMLDVSTAQAATNIAALAWIDQVHVTKDWPGTIRITVTERRPVAAMAYQDRWMLVDRHGRVVDSVLKLPHGVPIVQGPVGGTVPAPGVRLPATALLSLETIARVPPSLAGVVVSAMWDETGRTTATLSRGGEVLLPDGPRLGDAFVALTALLKSIPPGPIEGLIDLRVPTAPVIVDPNQPDTAAAADAAAGQAPSLTPVAP